MTNITSYGAVSGGTDCTQAFASAQANSNIIDVGPGDWYLKNWDILRSGITVKTAGRYTRFIQIPVGPIPLPMINIKASGTYFGLEGFSVVGNIATDVGEHNHSLFVRPFDNEMISDIKIGDVYGRDVRGDVLYIGGKSNAKVFDVQVGRISGSNILRNVISVTGGERIHVDGSIVEDKCGYMVFDIEPNGNSQACNQIRVDYLRGRNCGVYGLPNVPVGNVSFGKVFLSEDFQVNTDPGYISFDGLKYQAFILGNYTSCRIDSLKVNKHNYAALRNVTNTGDHVADLLDIGEINLSNCSLTDPTYPYYIIGGGTLCKLVTIGGGVVNLHSSSKRAIGLANLRVNNLSVNGCITAFCLSPVLTECKVESTYDHYVCAGDVGHPEGATFVDCDIKFTGKAGRLSAYSNNTVISSKVSVGNFIYPGQSTGNKNINSSIVLY